MLATNHKNTQEAQLLLV